MKEKRLNIGIVTFPISEAGTTPLSNLIDVLGPLSQELHVVTGGAGCTVSVESRNVQIHGIEHSVGAGDVFTRTMNYVGTQLRISRKLMKLSGNIDLWIFFIGGEGLVLPMLTAKLLRKTVFIASAGSGFKVARAQEDPLARFSNLLQSITYRLSDRIVMYSERLVEEHGLQKYRNKISIAPRHFPDFDKFKITRRLGERGNRVGYIGSLNEAKGVPNFLEAMPRVLEEKSQLEFLIGGRGRLEDSIKASLEKRGLNRVKLTGWIPHGEIPNYLNELKLLVLPSRTEGLPNIVLEAMACGTPVLATAVGAIADVIRDGETGFFMEDNSPDCIARNINRALDHPGLEQIAEKAHTLVRQEFTYEKALERYRKLLNEFPARK